MQRVSIRKMRWLFKNVKNRLRQRLSPEEKWNPFKDKRSLHQDDITIINMQTTDRASKYMQLNLTELRGIWTMLQSQERIFLKMDKQGKKKGEDFNTSATGRANKQTP